MDGDLRGARGLTARLGLERLGLRRGQTLAVTGGAGLLASYVIALASEQGLRVLADAMPEDEALVRSFGADALYDTALLGRAVIVF